MGDFIANHFVMVCLGVAVLLLGVLIWGISVDVANDNRLMAQCMADGKREYECVSLLRKPASQMVPVFIPMGR